MQRSLDREPVPGAVTTRSIRDRSSTDPAAPARRGVPARGVRSTVRGDARRRATRVRPVGLLLAAAATGLLAWALGGRAVGLLRADPWAEPTAWTAPGSVRVEDLVGLGAALVGTAVAAWFCLGLVLAAACAGARSAGRVWVAGERLVARAAPGVVRRALVVSAGTGVALAGTALPAVALAPAPPDDLGWAVTAEPWRTATSSPPATEPSTTGPITVPVPTAAAPVSAPAGPAPGAPPGTSPTAAGTGVPSPAAAGGPVAVPGESGGRSADAGTGPVPGPVTSPPTSPGTGSPTGSVTVERGDTLWAIARDHLPAAASAAAIAAAWPTWYAANHDVIGPDPDLIRPGQRLVPPTGAATDGPAR